MTKRTNAWWHSFQARIRNPDTVLVQLCAFNNPNLQKRRVDAGKAGGEKPTKAEQNPLTPTARGIASLPLHFKGVLASARREMRREATVGGVYRSRISSDFIQSLATADSH